jgi:hypothetical protein
VRRLAPALLLALAATPALADNSVHGRLELQDFAAFASDDSLDAALGAQDRNDISGNLRLTWEPESGPWSAGVHYVLAADYGDGARLSRLERGLLPEPPTTLFNLTNTFEDHGNIVASQTIDRLFVGYATPDFVLRVGRQALTWGGGLVFRPMDLFDPFAPNATDTEFKPGTDMLYAQFLFADGSDFQAIVVPRPVVKGGGPTMDASSFAGHFRTTISGLGATVLVARDHGDWTLAAELSGPWAGANWDLELVPTFLNSGPTRISALANISDAVTLFDRNATVFGEYFHNGFGVTGNTTFATLPPDLIDRLSRGQVFDTRQNYLAGGMTLEWTPLLNLSPTLIANLDDGGVFLLGAATYSLSDDMTLIGGAQVPLGRHGSEFGGLPVSPIVPATVSPSPNVYIQLRRYF